MDPFRNAALQSAKLQSLLSSLSSEAPRSGGQASQSDMPAPPAYHMVVDPHGPVPTIRSPYAEEGDEETVDEKEEEEEEAPEITINAATQVRGHGNIISIAQMDMARIANLVASMLRGDTPLSPSSDSSAHGATPCPQASTSTIFPSSPPLPSSSHLATQPARELRKFHVTVSCGATIIGDRNIVGPGLGDIARQMQVAQRNQALHAAQQRHQQQAQQTQPVGIAVPKTPVPGAGTSANAGLGTGVGMGVPKGRETLYQAQVATPPMSRSAGSRGQEVGGEKRKRDEEGGECCAKKQC